MSTFDDSQRARVATTGAAVYGEFGDEVAKPRMAKMLRRGTRGAAGSRVGRTAGFVDVYTNISKADPRDQLRGTPAPQFYAARFWRFDHPGKSHLLDQPTRRRIIHTHQRHGRRGRHVIDNSIGCIQKRYRSTEQEAPGEFAAVDTAD